MKVLIADDEPLAVERLSRLVTQMGHEVVATAHHGQDVLDHIENDSPVLSIFLVQASTAFPCLRLRGLYSYMGVPFNRGAAVWETFS